MPTFLEIVPATEDTTISQCKIMHAAQIAAHDAAVSIFDELNRAVPNMPIEITRTLTLVGLLSAVGHILADSPDQEHARITVDRSRTIISNEHQHWRNATKH